MRPSLLTWASWSPNGLTLNLSPPFSCLMSIPCFELFPRPSDFCPTTSYLTAFMRPPPQAWRAARRSLLSNSRSPSSWSSSFHLTETQRSAILVLDGNPRSSLLERGSRNLAPRDANKIQLFMVQTLRMIPDYSRKVVEPGWKKLLFSPHHKRITSLNLPPHRIFFWLKKLWCSFCPLLTTLIVSTLWLPLPALTGQPYHPGPHRQGSLSCDHDLARGIPPGENVQWAYAFNERFPWKKLPMGYWWGRWVSKFA